MDREKTGFVTWEAFLKICLGALIALGLFLGGVAAVTWTYSIVSLGARLENLEKLGSIHDKVLREIGSALNNANPHTVRRAPPAPKAAPPSAPQGPENVETAP